MKWCGWITSESFLALGGSTDFSFAQKTFEQRLAITKIGDDDVSAHPKQALAFPLVHAARTVVRLVAGHSHGQATDFFGVLNLHVTVAEGQQLFAADLVLPEDALDNDL